MHIQTEQGCKSLGELCYFSKDRVSATFANAYNYVSVDNLLPDKKGKTLASSVPDRGYLFQYQIGDILLGNIRPYLKKIWFADITGATNGDVLVVRTRMGNPISPRFVYYVLSSDDFFAYNMQNTKGTKMPRGDKEAIMNYEFHVPSLKEQERIASALSAVDELLASLDKQIAKTRDIKQGVMQQLLASPSKWRPLKEVCHALPNEAIRVTQLTEFGKYPVINSARKAIGYCDTYNNEGKSLVLTSHGEYAGYVHWLESPFFAGALCYPMRSKNENELLSKFIYYWLQNEEERIREKFVNRSGVPYVDAKAFFASSIHIPPLEEQKRIVGTLTSLDDTIEGLDAKRQKYESIKAGMMQQLLSCATCSVNS